MVYGNQANHCIHVIQKKGSNKQFQNNNSLQITYKINEFHFVKLFQIEISDTLIFHLIQSTVLECHNVWYKTDD